MKGQKTKILIILGSFTLIGAFFVLPKGVEAAAGINKQINFQGKVVNTDGTNVTNNSYNFLFCVYTTASPTTPCTSGALNDAIWRESKSLTVTDGVFQTTLGDTTVLPGTVDFNTDSIYLGINFNSNGQMTPLVQFTATPYAFNSLKLNGNDWASPAAIGTGLAAAGTFTNLSTTTGGISIAAAQAYAGVGAVTLTSAAGAGLTIDSGTNGALNIGTDSSAETINIGTGAAAKTLLIGSLNTTSGVTIQSGTTGSGISLQANGTSAGTVQIGDGGTSSATPDTLALDTGSAEPTGTLGAMYYNTALSAFRCYGSVGWVNCDTTGGSSGPIGSDKQIAFNDAGTESGDSGLTYDVTSHTLGLNGTDAGINMTAITNEPATPATGTMDFYAKSIAGRMMPKWVGPSGLDSIAQPLIAMNKVAWWNPTGNVTTAPVVIGFTAPTAQGTATSRVVATTRMFTRAKRFGYVSAATVGGLAGHYNAAAASNQYTIGTGTGLGGFTYILRFGTSDAATVSGARQFAGMTSATAAPTNVEPSTLTNTIGVGHGAADTNLKIYYGGSVAQTPIDLGSNFPANTLSTDLYELVLYTSPNIANTVGYRVTRLNTGDQVNGTLTAGTPGTQLPLSTTYLGHRIWRTNNATALAVGIDVASIYIEADN